MEQVGLRYGVRTDVGRVREVNEDDLLASPPVFAVADGMGGHDGGDVASRIAVEELRRLADDGYDPAAADAAVVEALARASSGSPTTPPTAAPRGSAAAPARRRSPRCSSSPRRGRRGWSPTSGTRAATGSPTGSSTR